MADTTVLLNNYSDDSQIKQFMCNELAPRVFHDIPISVLNSGFFSLVSEYISQITEQLGFTSSFYFNESFITKAVLPDSIYAEAAIFNIGYAFAIPASTNFLLELKIEDIYNNSVYNANTGLFEFVLDKNTKFNLPEGFVYSLDYDILIQYKNVETSNISASIPAWNIQYINRDEANMCATNRNTYITYRVTDTWLCLLVQANEYERQVHTVVNNTTNGVPNEDKVIACQNHIAGFDIKYIDAAGNEQYIPRDHILAIHDTVKDNNPYVHYIMDNPQTIRFMWQLNGNKYFVPETNSSFEITIYTCHGASANAPNYTNEQQPSVITASNRYSNNANVTKAAFVISGCVGGADIGTVETVRRQTIEAYNTANVLSTDHDIDEWFKTFYFRNILYPFFFKRRDDPWGRVWSGFIALTANDDYVYRTNTLHAQIPYDVLYNNAKNTVSNNEIIIPPGWIWTYTTDTEENKNLYTVVPYTKADGHTIETAKTLASIADKFVFSNPLGIRIQKDPFAIGYFNPWVNQYVTASKIERTDRAQSTDNNVEDISYIYHATPLITNIKRTYKDDHYDVTTHILPNIPRMNLSNKIYSSNLVDYTRYTAIAPQFTPIMWTYFKKPLDEYATNIPILPLSLDDGYIPFDPNKTYFCVKSKSRYDDNTWVLQGLSIQDMSGPEIKEYDISIAAEKMYTYGTNAIWGDDSTSIEPVYASGDATINLYPTPTDTDLITFSRVQTQNYYELRLKDGAPNGTISRIVVGEAVETELTKYGEQELVKIGRSYAASTYINVFYDTIDEHDQHVEKQVVYTITNAANIYMPYKWNPETSTPGAYEFDLHNLGSSGIILYADMKPSADTGSVDYYRIPFASLPKDDAMFYVHSEQLPLDRNNMRVILHTICGGSETGRVEMQPVVVETDGSYRYEATMYPLNELLDIDNRITIASVDDGGSCWKVVNGQSLYIDAMQPQLKISILFRSDDENRNSDIENDNGEYKGYRLVDEYMLDDVDLLQEIKEMRSVVDFGDTSMPTPEQQQLYDDMFAVSQYNASDPYNMYYLTEYAYNMTHDVNTIINPTEYADASFQKFVETCGVMKTVIDGYFTRYNSVMSRFGRPAWFDELDETFDTIISYDPEEEVYVLLTEQPDPWDPTQYWRKTIGDTWVKGSPGEAWVANIWYELKHVDLDWESIYQTFNAYPRNVNDAFKGVNIHEGITIQLVPFVEYSLMNSDRFEEFVTSFTTVHNALEPVIFNRLEGNNYLDCKLIATYGKPHSYSSDIDVNDPDRFWPDLNIQLEFDVKLYNQSLATNTINELRLIVKSYFNRITSVHTPVQAISMDNNIYISHVIQQMEAHDNVAWMKFKGWYTDEKNKTGGNYKDANTQAIVQKWKSLEDMLKDAKGKSELERYVPEMFVMDDDNIVINIIK